jgi:hypothetical protein
MVKEGQIISFTDQHVLTKVPTTNKARAKGKDEHRYLKADAAFVFSHAEMEVTGILESDGGGHLRLRDAVRLSRRKTSFHPLVIKIDLDIAKERECTKRGYPMARVSSHNVTKEADYKSQVKAAVLQVIESYKPDTPLVIFHPVEQYQEAHTAYAEQLGEEVEDVVPEWRLKPVPVHELIKAKVCGKRKRGK